jgi:hypothetical protein
MTPEPTVKRLTTSFGADLFFCSLSENNIAFAITGPGIDTTATIFSREDIGEIESILSAFLKIDEDKL